MREATARALSLDPDQWLANAIHGRMLMSDGNAWGAIESIERAIAINPSESELYTRRLFALNSLGRFREARASAEQAYRLDPLHTVTRSNYVELLVERGEFDKARELTPRNTVEAWELEAEIATQEHRWLDLVDVLKQGIAASEGGENTFLSGILADAYLFTFMAPELAKETEPSAFERFWIDAPANPAAYLPALSADEMAVNARAQDIGRIILLIALGNCEDIVAIQDRQEYLQGPVYGYLPSDTGSVVDQLLTYAWCLGEVGRTEDSNRLAQRIQGYFDASEINGAPPIHYDQAVVARILGDDDAATRHLRAAWENNDIGWFQLEAHWWDGLREREDFQAIKQALWERMNTLRAGIGLDPATPYQATLDRMAGQSEAQTAPAT
jgi:tetratricopeptide (TPR) repeat protein